MSSYTITEEPVQSVMFKRLHKEALEPVEQGDDVIVYIENKKRIFVRDRPRVIQGIADLLTIQGIHFNKYRSEQIEKMGDLFEGLESSPGQLYTGWYDWTCLSCNRTGQTTESNFQCHTGQTVVTRSDPCSGCPSLKTEGKYRFFACDSQDGLCPPGFPKGRRS